MLSIKLSFNNEFRRMAVPMLNGKPNINIDELVGIARRGYKDIGTEQVVFLWMDEDEDTITVSTNEELQFALDCMIAQSATAFKFTVGILKASDSHSRASNVSTNVPSEKLSNQVNDSVHVHVRCDECGVAPIIGIRYKCAVRNDFDLCEQCEGRNVQPFPMIKIYDPEQAPIAIMIALNDRDDNRGRPGFGRHGPHGHKLHGHSPHGHGHGPHGHGPHGPHSHPHPHHGRGRSWGGAHGNAAGPAGPVGASDSPHCDRKKWERSGSCPMKYKSAFINAWDSLLRPLSATSSEAPKAKGGDLQDLEQTILDEAVKASLEEYSGPGNIEPSSSASVSSTNEVESESTVMSDRKTFETSVQKETNGADANPLPQQQKHDQFLTPMLPALGASSHPSVTQAPITITKAAMRFIRDVTFPDGSKIQPGAVFAKIWRVRNDGNSVWPEGTILTTAGGDLLCAPDVKVSVPCAHPGEEIDVALTLMAPAVAGRHTAYFRLQSSSGVIFGQRLWADVVVEEEEPSWAVVSGVTLDSMLESVGGSCTEKLIVRGEIVPDEEKVDVMSADKVDVDGVQEDKSAASIVPSPLTASALAVDVAFDVWARVWSAELEVLAQMGFVDTKALIPILQQHACVPASLESSGNKGAPNPEGMQRVVMHLLTQSK